MHINSLKYIRIHNFKNYKKIILCLLNYTPRTVVKVSILKYLNLDNTQWRILNFLRGGVSRLLMSFSVK